MSELERIRAASLLSVLTIVLVVLFVLRGGDPDAVVPAHEALEICAMSKGSLCEDVARSAPDAVAVIPDRITPVAGLGAITVVAARLPADRFSELAASREGAAHLAALTEPADIQAAHVIEF